MTLVISVATPRYVSQVSDRRLRRLKPTRTTELYTDNANKSTILGCKDARAAIAYYGIGEDRNRTRTDTWLVKALQKTNPTRNSIDKVIKELAEQASAWIHSMSRIPDQDFLHTFVVTGWIHSKVPFVLLLSNYEKLTTEEKAARPWPEFASSHSILNLKAPNGFIFHRGGCYQALKHEDIELITRILQEAGAKPSDVVNVIVRAIRAAAESSSLIGQSCMSTLLLPGKPEVKCDYHPESGTQSSYMPNIVGIMPIWGVEIFTEEGTPPWHIREAVPAQLTKSKVRQGMRKLPASYRTGDALLSDLDPLLKKFLQSLPPGITEKEILDAL